VAVITIGMNVVNSTAATLAAFRIWPSLRIRRRKEFTALSNLTRGRTSAIARRRPLNVCETAGPQPTCRAKKRPNYEAG
jgi:hypothetical protein